MATPGSDLQAVLPFAFTRTLPLASMITGIGFRVRTAPDLCLTPKWLNKVGENIMCVCVCARVCVWVSVRAACGRACVSLSLSLSLSLSQSIHSRPVVQYLINTPTLTANLAP
jgi:hypothetical protein